MKDKIKSYKWYAAWEYEKEEKALNEASKKGLQLTKGGCFHSEFKRDNSVRYIYQLDYNTDIKDFIRYKDIFEEQGWEYINSTFNGWHYFRKLYQEGMEEDEAKIYTDRESLYEMQNRWLRLLTIFTGIYAVMAIAYFAMGIVNHQSLIVVEGLVFAILGLTMGLGLVSTRLRRAGKKEIFYIPFQWTFPAAIILLVASMFFYSSGSDTVFNENFNYIEMPQEKLPRSSSDIEIKKSGTYYLDLDFRAEKGTMMVSMQDQNGKEVYKNVANECTVNDWKLDLTAGTYRAYYSYQFDSTQAASASVRVDLKIVK